MMPENNKTCILFTILTVLIYSIQNTLGSTRNNRITYLVCCKLIIFCLKQIQHIEIVSDISKAVSKHYRFNIEQQNSEFIIPVWVYICDGHWQISIPFHFFSVKSSCALVTRGEMVISPRARFLPGEKLPFPPGWRVRMTISRKKTDFAHI